MYLFMPHIHIAAGAGVICAGFRKAVKIPSFENNENCLSKLPPRVFKIAAGLQILALGMPRLYIATTELKSCFLWRFGTNTELAHLAIVVGHTAQQA